MAAGADSRGYKRLTRTVDLAARPRRSCRSSSPPTSRRTGTGSSSRPATPGSDDWTTLPGPTGELTTHGRAHRARRARERGPRAAPVPRALLARRLHGDRPAPPASGTRSRAARAAGRTGRSTCPRTPASRSSSRSRVITDWGTLGLGTWVDDVKITDGATHRVDRLRGRQGRLGRRPTARRAPIRSSRNWTRRGQEFEEGGVVTTDDTVYTGFGFEGIDAPARQRVHEARDAAPGRRQGQPGQGQAGPGPAGRQLAGQARDRQAQGRQAAARRPQGQGPKVRVELRG